MTSPERTGSSRWTRRPGGIRAWRCCRRDSWCRSIRAMPRIARHLEADVETCLHSDWVPHGVIQRLARHIQGLRCHPWQPPGKAWSSFNVGDMTRRGAPQWRAIETAMSRWGRPGNETILPDDIEGGGRYGMGGVAERSEDRGDLSSIAAAIEHWMGQSSDTPRTRRLSSRAPTGIIAAQMRRPARRCDMTAGVYDPRRRPGAVWKRAPRCPLPISPAYRGDVQWVRARFVCAQGPNYRCAVGRRWRRMDFDEGHLLSQGG